ncbi:hypothetical protein WH47_12084 [Habropoda laboriosa]|uniref:DDE Tnp4 domain-containing protein n=1 Tax=Habropoda laboriosa TaxID=597456 RepID=A0A0L7R173_9HYME|nr:hypothetical protein WH47_12084 [Habropoda laboriosa]
MSIVFELLRKPMLLGPEKAEEIILACAYLHNFLRKGQSSTIYCPPGTIDSDSTTAGELIPGERLEGLQENLVNLENR